MINEVHNKNPKKIALFLGTFDPIHNGHMHIAKSVLHELSLDEVLIIPSFDSPHKGENLCTCTDERLTMCELACEDVDNVDVSDIEIKNKLEGYSLKKIDLIAEKYSESKLYYIIGSDTYMTMMKWSNLEYFISKVSLCVIIREKKDLSKVREIKKNLEKLKAETFICNFETLDISSTRIRKLIKSGDSISSLVSENIENYIYENRLYR